MPKVDPETRQPLNDEPEQYDDELRGGKTIGDPALKKGDPKGTTSRLSPRR